jgi:hypothetical protein
MIFLKEFVWRVDHYAYHLTLNRNIPYIQAKGLVPQTGQNSKAVGDSRRAIYFFDCLGSVLDWISALYPNEDIENIELLRFNLKNRIWGVQNQEIGDFYIERPVKVDKLSYLRIYDSYQNLVLFREIEDIIYGDKSQYQMIWEDLSTYNHKQLIKGR